MIDIRAGESIESKQIGWNKTVENETLTKYDSIYLVL